MSNVVLNFNFNTSNVTIQPIFKPPYYNHFSNFNTSNVTIQLKENIEENIIGLFQYI